MGNTTDKFKLPTSSKPELDKIIKAYVHIGKDGKDATLDDLARLTSINKTTISSNNGFLAGSGLISGGRAKSATELGKKLGRALEHDQQEDVRRSWQEVIKQTQFLSDLVTTVEFKEGMTKDELVPHVLYVSGLPNKAPHPTGARTIVDILTESGLLAESDDKLKVAQSKDKAAPSSSEVETSATEVKHATETPAPTPVQQPTESAPVTPQGITAVSQAVNPSVVINIQLEIPATEDEAIYNNFFRALKENLLKPDDK